MEYMNTIIHDDCVTGMMKLPSESFDIIICDPPYNIGKDFGNDSDKQTMQEYLHWCDQWIAECLRLLRPDGTMYIYGYSETLAFLRVRLPCHVRWLVWHYTNKTSPNLNFWQRSHESILCCSKTDKPRFNRDAVRVPYTKGHLKNAGRKRPATKGRFSDGSKETVFKAHQGGALPRDVIKTPALSGSYGGKERVAHPTQKPLELCDQLIKAVKPDAEGVMLVPFAGSGSECVSAKKLGVAFIGFELNEQYIKIAYDRLNQTE